MTYVIGFNGPPRSGKDTAAHLMQERVEAIGYTIPIKIEALSLPLRHIAYAMTGWSGPYTGDNYELFKGTHFAQFGTNGRQLLIDVSERFLKPNYGIEIMAQMLIERNRLFQGLLLITDCGFQCEVNPLATHYGPNNLFIARIEREDCDFTYDSREWVFHANDGSFKNNGSLKDLAVKMERLLTERIYPMDWHLS